MFKGVLKNSGEAIDLLSSKCEKYINEIRSKNEKISELENTIKQLKNDLYELNPTYNVSVFKEKNNIKSTPLSININLEIPVDYFKAISTINVSFRCEKGFPSFRDKNIIYVSKRNMDKRMIGKEGFVAVNLD